MRAISLFVKINGVLQLCNSVNIQHLLNGISSATLSIEQPNDDILFTPVEIYMDSNIIFSGVCTGGQPYTTSGKVAYTVTAKGELYKLNQMNPYLLGFQVIDGPGNINRAKMSKFNSHFISTYSNAKGITDLLSYFQYILGQIIQYIITVIPEIETNKGNRSETQLSSSLTELYKFHASNNSKFIDEQFKKILKIGMDSDILTYYPDEIKREELESICQNPGATFWDILILFCSKYQLCIGAHKDKIYMAPYSPMQTPSLTIAPQTMTSINVSPLPLNMYTRCYLNPPAETFPSGVYTGSEIPMGTYPELDKCASPTQLEKRLNCIRVLRYNAPGLALYLTSSLTNSASDVRKTIDALAKMYFFSENFKHRYGNISCIYLPDIPVGITVKFDDTFFKKSYRGYVTEVTHVITTDSIQTNIGLQYVIEDKEIDFLGFGTLDFTNSIYPKFTGKSLLEAVS